MDRIGNVRSCRDYFVYWSFEWDAVYFHFGGPFYIAPVIEQKSTNNVTGANYGGTGKGVYGNAYYRTSDRKAPQNAYLSAKGQMRPWTSWESPKPTGKIITSRITLSLLPESSPNTLEQYQNSFSASKIDMAKTYTVSKTSFEYNAEDGLYYRFEYGKAPCGC